MNFLLSHIVDKLAPIDIFSIGLIISEFEDARTSKVWEVDTEPVYFTVNHERTGKGTIDIVVNLAYLRKPSEEELTQLERSIASDIFRISTKYSLNYVSRRTEIVQEHLSSTDVIFRFEFLAEEVDIVSREIKEKEESELVRLVSKAYNQCTEIIPSDSPIEIVAKVGDRTAFEGKKEAVIEFKLPINMNESYVIAMEKSSMYGDNHSDFVVNCVACAHTVMKIVKMLEFSSETIGGRFRISYSYDLEKFREEFTSEINYRIESFVELSAKNTPAILDFSRTSDNYGVANDIRLLIKTKRDKISLRMYLDRKVDFTAYYDLMDRKESPDKLKSRRVRINEILMTPEISGNLPVYIVKESR